MYQVITLLTSTLCIDANGPLTCPINTNIDEVMVALTLVVMGPAPIPCHYCPKAMSLGNAPLKLPYLLAHTSDWGVCELSKIWMP